MALDPRYVTSLELQSAFLDKTTGLQLAGGVVYFYQDSNRNNPKNVYQLSGSPPNYTYTALPNPITLTNAGTFSDGSNNDISVYYYPYDVNGEPDNYYVAVYEEPSLPPFPPVGTPILTREAVPGVIAESGPGATGPSSTENEILNSQFATVLFDPAVGMNVAYMAGITTAEFAPGWFINITASGSGSVAISRTSIAGSSNFATNPPYYLTIVGAANISDLFIYQRLEHNPNIFANGYISAGLALPPGSPQVNIYYAPQGNRITPALFTFANTSGAWEFESTTSLLGPGTNSTTSDAGYTDIQIGLLPNATTILSSVQVIGLATDIENIPYNQQPVIAQQNQTYFYDKPLLNYKPIPSYLVGWDFPLNPAQFLGSTVPATGGYGANKSFYAWDQTIVFQSINNGVAVSRDTNGGFKLTGAGAGQTAIIQYLDQIEARKILSNRISVYLNASTSLASLGGTISLWATSAGALPNVATGTNNSIVLSLDANGNVSSPNGAWTQVTRGNFGNATFTLGTTATDLALNQWDFTTNALATTATYFAIVIGFAAIANTDTITINSVGLCSGDIATPPAPKTFDETLNDCEAYFEKSYDNSDLAGTITSNGALVAPMQSGVPQAAGGNTYVNELPFGFPFKNNKRKAPNVTIYSPVSGTVGYVRYYAVGNAANAFEDIITRWATVVISKKYASYTNPGQSGVNYPSASQTPLINWIQYHYIADARLGIVL